MKMLPGTTAAYDAQESVKWMTFYQGPKQNEEDDEDDDEDDHKDDEDEQEDEHEHRDDGYELIAEEAMGK